MSAETETPPASRAGAGWIPGEVGVWVFIVGDMVMFAMLFGTYLYERRSEAASFASSQDALNTTIGAVNTFVLLTSSLLVALAVHAVRGGAAERAQRLLLGAMGCGLVFGVDKFIEWSHLVSIGATPAENTFYMLFFVLTGIHFLHLVIGMGVLVFLRGVAGRERPERHISTVETGASYWHLVDLLWVVLFPLMYMVA